MTVHVHPLTALLAAMVERFDSAIDEHDHGTSGKRKFAPYTITSDLPCRYVTQDQVDVVVAGEGVRNEEADEHDEAA
jgi:hypothetical protein